MAYFQRLVFQTRLANGQSPPTDRVRSLPSIAAYLFYTYIHHSVQYATAEYLKMDCVERSLQDNNGIRIDPLSLPETSNTDHGVECDEVETSSKR